ncbi:MAG TPA: winged helix-turn-helix domain-containing protein [Bryobacteraceae bacterium]|nr:winged helix-turn-helix domain-containing protein [Bryobacteraceae bacterium]
MQGVEESISLGPFRVNLAASRLHRDGVELDLRPRAFRALRVLIQNPGRLVEYEQMIREAWDGVHVSKHTVAVTIGEIKQVLGEYGSWIHCQPKFGYRLEIPQSEVLIRKAWHYWSQYNQLGFEHALRCFEEAAELDSADFRAWEGISSTHLMLGSFVMRPPRDLVRPFWHAHEQAVEACGLTWELRLNAAYARFVFDHDLATAERELVQLQRERPNSPHVYIRLAMVYLAGHRLEEARALMPPALAADALLPPLAFIGCLLRLYGREFDSAIEWSESQLDLHPSSQIGRVHYAEALEFAGRLAEAKTQYEIAFRRSESPIARVTQARFLARAGEREEALRIYEELQEARKHDYLDAFQIALLAHALGRRDEAFEELERALEENSYTLLFLNVDGKADPLRQDPRFALLAARVFPPTKSAASTAV